MNRHQNNVCTSQYESFTIPRTIRVDEWKTVVVITARQLKARIYLPHRRRRRWPIITTFRGHGEVYLGTYKMLVTEGVRFSKVIRGIHCWIPASDWRLKRSQWLMLSFRFRCAANEDVKKNPRWTTDIVIQQAWCLKSRDNVHLRLQGKRRQSFVCIEILQWNCLLQTTKNVE